MSDYSLDDAYSEALELEEKVEKARHNSLGFYVTMEEDDIAEELISSLSETVETHVDTAHDAYKDLKENLYSIEQIREDLTSPEKIMNEAEERDLEELFNLDVSVNRHDRAPDNPEETVRIVVESLSNYNTLHDALERSSYDFDLPELEFEEDTGEIIEKTADETINRERPEGGQFFTEE